MSVVAVSNLKKALFNWWVPFIFIVFVLCIAPIKQSFEFDPDEGINLIKAFLYSEGFSLYTDIWSDQPPLFTSLLSYWFVLFGRSIFAARILTLLFSALLVWSFYQTLRIQLGNLLACISTLLLITSRKFIQLSVSVMIGIPSLALVMFSIYILTLYKQKARTYLIFISGFLLALSLQTKFFTVFLIPIMLFYLLSFRVAKKQGEETIGKKLSPAILWLITVLFFYILISFLYNSFQYEQLIQAHLQQSIATDFEDYDSLSVLYWMIRHDYDIAGLALIGVFIIFDQKHWKGLFPFVWLVTATLLLLIHQPVWYHHYSLISIPLAWLAAYGATPAIALLKSKDRLLSFKQFNLKKQLFTILALVLFVVLIVNVSFKINSAIETMQIKEPHHDVNVVNLLSQHRESTKWVLTDRPIYAFYAGLHIPPEIAVFTKKRFRAGKLNYDYLLSILQKYNPEQIVLSRFKKEIENEPEVNDYLEKNYSKIYETDAVHYFISKVI